MRRGLLVVNLLLVLAAIWLIIEIRQTYLMARQREADVRALAVRPLDLPLPQLSQPQEPTQAVSYLTVAQQMLFSLDRSSAVILPPPPAPPPLAPVPPFPVVYGVMNFAGPVSVLMSSSQVQQQKRYQQGDSIGDFKVKALDSKQMTLALEDGREFTKKLAEMAAKAEVAQTAASAPSQPAAPVTGSLTVAKKLEVQAEPGLENNGVRMCQPGDDSPAGTVKDGYRKTLRPTGFGTQCFWTPAN